ncbi:MAG: hypothetical protein U0414_33515 [Polyangiaceae bacterium]
MGLNLSAMAIHAPASAVAPALDEILRSVGLVRLRGGSARAKPHTRIVRFAAGESDDWSILVSSGERFMPRVALELSRALDTDVLGIDAYDQYSYAHASHVAAGEPRFVCTMNSAEIVERVPADLGAILMEGARRTQRRMPARVRDSIAAGEWAEFENLVFDFYWESIAPTDAMTRAFEILEACPYELDYAGDPAPVAMDLQAGAFWSAHAARLRRGGPKAFASTKKSSAARRLDSASKAPAKPSKAAKPAKSAATPSKSTAKPSHSTAKRPKAASSPRPKKGTERKRSSR